MPTVTITEAGLRTIFTNVDFVGAAVSTMLVYEYFITFGDEVRYFWKRRSLGPSVLFYLNRYLNLILAIFQLIVLNPAYHRSPERCMKEMPTLFVLEVLGSFPWGAFSAMRAYALSQNIPLSLLIFLLSLVPIMMNFACFKFGLGGYSVPVVSCVGYNKIPPFLSHRFTISARLCVILADALLLITTWTRLYQQRKLNRLRDGPKELTLSDVILRDGTIYFLIMLLLNCLHIAFTLVSIFSGVASLQPLSSVSIFVTPLTAILVSRFIIHLQAADRQAPRHGLWPDSQAPSADVETRMSSLVFESVIGSIRCELEPEDIIGSKGGSTTSEYEHEEEYSLGECTGPTAAEDAPCAPGGDVKG